MKHQLKSLTYLIILCIFFSCNSVSTHSDSIPVSTEKLDTIKSVPSKVSAIPLLFENAFIKGTQEKIKTATLSLYGITIGKIKIPTGRIIACDPLHIEEYGIPFTQQFPTGEFPVQLSIAKWDDKETIAFARIAFNDEPVERWEFALLPGQQPLPVGDRKIHGYGIDAGIAIFLDEAASKVVNKKRAEDTDTEIYQEMNKHYHHNWKYAIYNFGQYNLAAFNSGTGDGRYATYIGFDAQGKPCRLLSDFDIFDWRQK